MAAKGTVYIICMLRHLWPITFLAALALLTGAFAPADDSNLPPNDLNRVKEGTLAPDFTLEDLDGKPVTLSSFRGKKKVVLVFYRGYW